MQRIPQAPVEAPGDTLAACAWLVASLACPCEPLEGSDKEQGDQILEVGLKSLPEDSCCSLAARPCTVWCQLHHFTVHGQQEGLMHDWHCPAKVHIRKQAWA